MGPHRKRFLYNLATPVTLLRGETRVDSDHLMTSSLSLLFKDIEERAPTGIHDAFCQAMILDHVENSQLLNRNHLVLFDIAFGRLIPNRLRCGKIKENSRRKEMKIRYGSSRHTSSLAPVS